MELILVESAMISAVAYDDARQDLIVIFNTGQTYVYSDVPRDTYDALLAADSKGTYMQDHIIDHFPYRRGFPRRR
jgi:hypothetical protein